MGGNGISTHEGCRRLLFVVTEDWYFVSHRLQLAERMQAAGFQVAVATRSREFSGMIERTGLTLFYVPFERSLRRPWADLRSLWALSRILRRWRPHIVHLVALKPILLGTMAIRLAGQSCFAVLAFTGMGFLFSSNRYLARLLRPIVVSLLQQACKADRNAVIVQNDADARLVAEKLLPGDGVPVTIAGAGVDIEKFADSGQPPASGPIVLMASRLLRDKGVYEFANAARMLKSNGCNARFVLVGMFDKANHGAVKREDLNHWIDGGVLEWWGYRDDMPEVYLQASVVCLPSYREGFPKALLEAAACARPLIASDIPGCRSICVNELTGVSVPPRNTGALATAIERILNDPELGVRMGKAARELVETRYTIDKIAAATLSVYESLSGPEE